MISAARPGAPPRRCFGNWRGAVAAALAVAGFVSCGGTIDGVAPSSPAGNWVSEFERDHPLTGRLWQPARQRFTDADSLLTALARSDFVLIGEKHDNPDHHRLQAWVVERMIASGRRVAVAFEMLTADQIPAMTGYLREHPKDAGGLAAAVNWSETGWPDWQMYRPIAQAALDAGLPVVAADVARGTVRAMGRHGEGALPKDIRDRLGDVRPADAAVKAAMAEEMQESHCNLLSDALTEKMIFIQRVRNAYLAASMVDAATAPGLDGAVLITGTGHARTDRGTPEFLHRMVPGRKVVSVGLIESLPDRRTPEEYAATFGARSLPFDFVWFTARHGTDDPCKTHADALKRLKHRQ